MCFASTRRRACIYYSVTSLHPTGSGEDGWTKTIAEECEFDLYMKQMCSKTCRPVQPEPVHEGGDRSTSTIHSTKLSGENHFPRTFFHQLDSLSHPLDSYLSTTAENMAVVFIFKSQAPPKRHCYSEEVLYEEVVYPNIVSDRLLI